MKYAKRMLRIITTKRRNVYDDLEEGFEDDYSDGVC